MTAEDIAAYRKYINLDESEYVDLVNDRDSDSCTAMDVRWIKAWAGCDFNDRLVADIIAADKLLRDSICGMNKDVCDLVRVRKMQSKEEGRQVDERISAALYVEKVQAPPKLGELYRRRFEKTKETLSMLKSPRELDMLYGTIFRGYHNVVCRCKNSVNKLTRISNIERNSVIDNGICYDLFERNKIAKEYIRFLRSMLHLYSVYLRSDDFLHVMGINSNIRSMMNLRENVGAKWAGFFTRLDNFKGAPLCFPLLFMIGEQRLTPEDVCAIRSYSYTIEIEHRSVE